VVLTIEQTGNFWTSKIIITFVIDKLEDQSMQSKCYLLNRLSFSMPYISWSITISNNCCVVHITIWGDLSSASLGLHISMCTEGSGDVFGLQAARHIETQSAFDHLYWVLDVVTLPGKPDSLSTHCLDWLQGRLRHNQWSSKYWWVPTSWRLPLIYTWGYYAECMWIVAYRTLKFSQCVCGHNCRLFLICNLLMPLNKSSVVVQLPLFLDCSIHIRSSVSINHHILVDHFLLILFQLILELGFMLLFIEQPPETILCDCLISPVPKM
jgi:hypothetical protein